MLQKILNNKLRIVQLLALIFLLVLIRAFENDLLYSNTIPAFSGRGFRWYLLGRLDLSKINHIKIKNNISFFLKFAQTVERNQDNDGFAGDFPNLLITSDLKFQILVRF